MQFAIDWDSFSLLELLHTVKGLRSKRHDHKKKNGNSFFVGSVKELTCNVQCNRALICILIMCYSILLLLVLVLYYFNNIGLQVSLSYKSHCCRFSCINRYVPCNMILMDPPSPQFCKMRKLCQCGKLFSPLRFRFEQVLLYYIFGHYPLSCLYLKCCPVSRSIHSSVTWMTKHWKLASVSVFR
jgi:hypothetical protein